MAFKGKGLDIHPCGTSSDCPTKHAFHTCIPEASTFFGIRAFMPPFSYYSP